MVELLDRHELPAQAVYERGEDVTATVPVHLGILSLSTETRTQPLVIDAARDTVGAWYDEDMDYYLSVLQDSGTKIPHLRGYEEFQSSWRLSTKPDEHGFLALHWQEQAGTHPIVFSPLPVILYNQFDGNGEFYSPAQNRAGRYIECISRSRLQGEVVLMPPTKMKQYGEETDIARVRESAGVAEVQGVAFSSEYYSSLAKTLLLRNFAVYYLNELAKSVE